MSSLSYTVGPESTSGVTTTVGLQLVNTRGITRQPVWSEDGQDYLKTRWMFDVLAVINQYATSQDGATIQPGFRPAITEKTLRNVLMKPRGRLVFTADDGLEILRAPANDRLTDASGGPKPVDFNIVRIAGSESIHVRWVVVCDVNECASRPVVLSHRWEMSEHQNSDYLPTRVVNGVVAFNVAELIAHGIDPDFLRGIFPHPVPIDFQRRDAQVTPSSDGTTYRYQIVDDMLPIRRGPKSPVTRIEATHSEQVTTPTVQETIQEANYNPAGAAAGATAAAAFILSGKSLKYIKRLSPHFYTHLIIRCWGAPGTSRRTLERWAIGVAAGRMGWFKLGFGIPTVEMVLTHDLAAPFVEFRLSVQHAPGIFTVAQIAGVTMEKLLPTTAALKDEVKTIGGDLAFTTGHEPGVGAPFENQTRTRWLGAIISQFLKGGCQAPVDAANYKWKFTFDDSELQDEKDKYLRTAPNQRSGATNEKLLGQQSPGA